MELKKYYERQEQLDDYIVQIKGLEGRNLVESKILALQVEIGELLNELPEVFKHWSHKKNNLEKALEEYVDGLHFLLSLGLELRIERYSVDPLLLKDGSLIDRFNDLFYLVGGLYRNPHDVFIYDRILQLYLAIGQELGFKELDIEFAYLKKNNENHTRQDNAY